MKMFKQYLQNIESFLTKYYCIQHSIFAIKQHPLKGLINGPFLHPPLTSNQGVRFLESQFIGLKHATYLIQAHF